MVGYYLNNYESDSERRSINPMAGWGQTRVIIIFRFTSENIYNLKRKIFQSTIPKIGRVKLAVGLVILSVSN